MIYLDNAATSHPKPEAVYRNMDQVLRHFCANPGRSGHKMAIEAGRIIFEAREKIGRLFNIKHTDRIIFTQNATAALNLAINGLLEPGDHCVTTDMEHNSVLRPLKNISLNGVKVDRVVASEDGFLDPADVSKAIGCDTRLVAITHASNVIGTITPIKEIIEAAHAKGVPVLVDASQTAGTMPIDVEGLGIDFMACPGHKGLLGPQGTGLLYISPAFSLRPLIFGGTGSRSDLDRMPDFLPDRFEAGTLNTPGIAGLAAGVEFLMGEGLENVRAHEVEIMTRLVSGISAIDGATLYGCSDPAGRTSVLSFTIEGVDPAFIGERLDRDFDIAVRVGLHCAPDAHRKMGSFPKGAVRMSPGYFTTLEDIDRAIEAVAEVAKTRSGKEALWTSR